MAMPQAVDIARLSTTLYTRMSDPSLGVALIILRHASGSKINEAREGSRSTTNCESRPGPSFVRPRWFTIPSPLQGGGLRSPSHLGGNSRTTELAGCENLHVALFRFPLAFCRAVGWRHRKPDVEEDDQAWT